MPVTHNDGRPVDAKLLEQTWDEILAHIGGMWGLPHTVLGVWLHEGMRFEEEMRRLVVDAEETSDHQQFFSQLKAVLLDRFEQIEIYIVSYPVDVL